MGYLFDRGGQESHYQEQVCPKWCPEHRNHSSTAVACHIQDSEGDGCQPQGNQLQVEVLEVHLSYCWNTLVTEQIIILQMRVEAMRAKFTRIIPLYLA